MSVKKLMEHPQQWYCYREHPGAVMSGGGKYRVELLGAFRLSNPEGKQIPITSKKGRALIALLARAPRGERARPWLQSMLWSRCDRLEAQNSLRRELANLRKLPGLSDILVADHGSLRLHKERCLIDTELAPAGMDGALLEGLDLFGEDQFEDWLRAERAGFLERSALQPHQVTLPAPIIERPSRLCIGLTPVLANEHDTAALLDGEMLLDRLAAALVQTGLVDVADFRIARAEHDRRPAQLNGPDVLVALRILRSGHGTEVALRVTRLVTTALVFVKKASLASESLADSDAEECSIFVQEAVDQLLHALSWRSEWQQEPRHLAAKHTLCAIEQMFSLSHFNVEEAERNLAAACAIQPQSTFYAWRAYRSVFLRDEPGAMDFRLLCEQAEEFARQALVLDPYNGLSLSLLTHVSSFVFADFARAADYLGRAKGLACDHVMMHDADAMLSFYTGSLAQARRAAQRAELLGRHLPYRYCFATSQCMIEALSGNLQEAIRHGERALALQPRAARKAYPPTLRYLGASYSAVQRYDMARQLFAELKRIDPDASSDKINMKSYPTPSDHAAAFVRKGLSAVAM